MKISEQEFNQIQKYLDKVELTQVDLRNEVLDHMTTSIEQRRLNQNLSFEESFEQEIKKWKKDLDNDYSSWLGLFWSGPRIMIKKCSKITTVFFLRIFLMAALLAGLILSGNQSSELVFWFTKIIGYVYLIGLCLMIVLWFRIKASGFDSTYKFLFKAHAVGFGFAYITFNPVWSNILLSTNDNKILFAHYFALIFWLGLFYFFFNLYTSHLRLSKRLLIK
jgi:hypothetical protein